MGDERTVWGLVGLVFLAVMAMPTAQPAPQAQDQETVYDLGPGITPPRVTKQVNPNYTGSKGVRIVGSVLIGLVVDSKGLPQDPRVIKSLEKDVDLSAVEAVKQWRFAPARKDGKAVAVRITLEIEFHSM